MQYILYLILTFAFIIFTFSLGRYPFLNPNRNIIFVISAVATVTSLLLMTELKITLSGYELFLLSILGTVFFRHGRKRKYLYGSLLFKKGSNGSFITVEENLSKKVKVVKRDGKTVSGINLKTSEPVFKRNKYPHLVELFPKRPKQILVIGANALAYCLYAFRMNPNQRIDIIEEDPAVIEAAKKFLPIPKARRFRIIRTDFFKWIKGDGKKKYDLIFVNLDTPIYSKAIKVEEPLIQNGALASYQKILNPYGSLIINILTSLQKDDMNFVSEKLSDFKQVFKSRLMFTENPEEAEPQLQNVISIFSNQEINIGLLKKNLKKLPEDELSYSKYHLEKMLATYYPTQAR